MALIQLNLKFQPKHKVSTNEKDNTSHHIKYGNAL